MPQLMPLNWICSSVVIITILVAGSMMYSIKNEALLLTDKEVSSYNLKSAWCW